MSDLQAAKAVVRAMQADLAAAAPDGAARALAAHVAPDWHWRGMHPFHERTGPDAVADAFWAPLMGAFTRLHRRPDIFLASRNRLPDRGDEPGVWVVSMGHLMGLFDRPWLGIRPTGRIAMLRYAEFDRVQDGRVVESAMFCDIPHVMIQAGQDPFPPQTGAHLIQPGPMTHRGLMWDAQDPAEGDATFEAIERMLTGMGEAESGEHPMPSYADHLRRTWHDDMIWWGPAGIGASYTVDRYIDQHCTPFGRSLDEGYRFNGHLARVAEGDFGGFFGWANLTVTNSGGFMGMPAGPGPADMRVVDMYRRDGDKLAENWIFIDMLHFLAMQGLDVLARNAGDGP
ncbi:MAG: nuclear transport factor 2 family protein [Paracoccaceae bacterium]